jgi:aldose 1-epimerase
MLSKTNCLVLILSAVFLIRCNPKTEVSTQPADTVSGNVKKGVEQSSFGQLPDGTKVSLFTMTNSRGVVMKVMNYGGIITSLLVPDRNGTMEDIVLGYDSLEGYLTANPYFGALIGRYGNRIARGKFLLGGKQYSLATNNGVNHLHGGLKGFDKVFWTIEEQPSDKGVAIRLTYQSKDMEEGYPGNLTVRVLYLLNDNNELELFYEATTDKKTIVNLTQHTYFNLTACKQDILSHQLELNASHFLPVDATLIPTGELLRVENTPFDFRTSFRIGGRIDEDHPQLKAGNGYDHCWALSKDSTGSFSRAAVLYDSASGRQVTVTTTEPGIQFYSGNFLDGSIKGKNGIVYNFRYGLCLETQHFPDSPNKGDFPPVVLEPGSTYRSQTKYSFSVR